MRQALVAGNWKMHGSRASVADLVKELGHTLEGIQQARIVLCPPFVYLFQVGQLLQQAGLSCTSLGAQDVCAQAQSKGAYTGEVSAQMLLDAGCEFVIVGHSERRQYQQETDQLIAEKFVQVQEAGLTPILCIGESLAEREAGETFAVLERQVMAVVTHVGIAAFQKAVLAYEPIWAIGTGKTASPEQAQEVHAFLRTLIAGLDGTVATHLRILYGGSVKAENAAQLFAAEDIDGALVGGASLDAGDFASIGRAAEQRAGH